jgi:hypothetical protein
VWHPEGVGKVPGYPKSPEAFAANSARLASNTAKARANGTLSRRGVPNGWAGRKLELEELRRNSQTAGEMLADEFLLADRSDFERHGDIAIAVGLSFALNPSVVMRHRLRAANIVLPYLLSKPVRMAVLGASTNRGVDFLEALVEVLKAAPDKT